MITKTILIETVLISRNTILIISGNTILTISGNTILTITFFYLYSAIIL